MAKTKSTPKSVDKLEYGSSKIEIQQFDVEQKVKIDGNEIPVHRDPSTGAFITSEAPYRQYGSPEEAAKAVIDLRNQPKR